MLEVRDIHTYYGDSYVLQGVSLQAAQGTVVAVLGRNGMGKTTLMRSIIGYTPTAPRSALVQGQDGLRSSPAPPGPERRGEGAIPRHLAHDGTHRKEYTCNGEGRLYRGSW